MSHLNCVLTVTEIFSNIIIFCHGLHFNLFVDPSSLTYWKRNETDAARSQISENAQQYPNPLPKLKNVISQFIGLYSQNYKRFDRTSFLRMCFEDHYHMHIRGRRLWLVVIDISAKNTFEYKPSPYYMAYSLFQHKYKSHENEIHIICVNNSKFLFILSQNRCATLQAL